jgi:ribonuclease P protein component
MQEERKEESVFLFLDNLIKSNSFKAKIMRLNAPQDFKRCFLSRKRIKNVAFTLHYVENNGQIARLGVNIAKKKIKKAVDRNKIKRAAREAFRKGHFKGIDIVLILKNEKFYDRTKCFKMINEVFNDLMKR